MPFKCVNCGAKASALYKTYGPSVLKLTKCEKCKGIVDKYVEYDPVIVMIDLVLISKEAQRHIIYNTEFKSYWKLLIILSMLETYGMWHNDSLFSIAVNNICDIKTNNTINTTYLSLSTYLAPTQQWSGCDGWRQDERDDADLFIWEKDFYIQFLATAAGTLVVLTTVFTVMSLMMTHLTHKAHLVRLLKSFSLAHAGALLALPMLVWGAASPPPTRLLHYSLVMMYELLVSYHVLTVVYEETRLVTILVLVVSNLGKYLTIFHMTPLIRRVLSAKNKDRR